MKKTLFVLLMTVMLSFTLTAQEQSGEIAGKVLLPDSSAVPGVTVTVKGTNLVGVRTTISDENGGYRFPALPGGEYTITFTLDGFKTIIRKGVKLEIGKTLLVDGVMTAGELREEVFVEGTSPLVDVRKSSTATNLTKETISKLPKGRDFTGIVSTQAGVNYEEGSSGSGISFDGASSSENTFFVDGMNTTSTYSGASGQGVNYDSVEEVQVKSSGYNAEYGGSMGGVVSVITKSGGNEFRGSLVAYYNNYALTTSNRAILRLDPADESEKTPQYFKAPYKDKGYKIEPGINIGGYIIKDRLWFFVSAMPSYSKFTRPAYFENDKDNNGKEFSRISKRIKGSAKITAAITNNLRLNLSGTMDYHKYKGAYSSRYGTSSYDSLIAQKDVGETMPGVTVAGGLDYSIGNNLFLNVSGGYYRSNRYDSGNLPEKSNFIYFMNSNKHLDLPDDQYHGKGTVYGSVAARSRGLRDISERKSVKGDLTYYFNAGGEHVAKAGFSFANVMMDQENGNVMQRWYLYWKNGDKNAFYSHSDNRKIPVKYGILFGYNTGKKGKLDTDRWAFYLQDSWTIGTKLTLNYGVRFEKENMPSMDENRKEAAFKFGFFDKIAPRVGFSYDINGDGKNKLFGSFGIYYDVMKLAMAVGSFGGATMWDVYYNLTDTNWKNLIDKKGFGFTGSVDPVNGGELLEKIDGRVPSFDLVQPNMKPYSKMEISLGYQRTLSDNLSLTIRLMHNRILNAIEDIGVKIGSNEHYFIGNPGSDWINQKYKEASETPNDDGKTSIPKGAKCPDPKREYYSMQINLDKKFSDNWFGGISLTLSRLTGNFSGLASTDEEGRQDPNVARYFDAWFLHYDSQMNSSDGVLPTDRPIDFKLYGAYTFDFGLTVGTNMYVRSGTPVSTYLPLKKQQGYYPNGRGDMGRTPVMWNIDLYAEYNMKLSDKMNLNFNVNINNLTDNSIATRKYNGIVSGTKVELTNEEIIKGYDVDEIIKRDKHALNPLYGMKYGFTAPLTVRFGMKLSF